VSKKEWDFIKIPITEKMIKSFFMNGERYFKVSKGINQKYFDDWSVVGVIQDYSTAIFYILLRRGKQPEGTVARELIPNYRRIDKKMR